MSYVVGALAGVAGGLACIWFVGDVPGVVAGIVVAALLYLGVGKLLAPEAKLGDVAASLVPDGEAAAERIAEARKLGCRLDALAKTIHEADVHAEICELAEDIERLCAAVEEQPSAYRRLAHFLATYGDACCTVLENYRSIERVRAVERTAETSRRVTDDSLVRAHADVLSALNDLQGAAQGELARAMGSKTAELAADSGAVRRLMELDGYTTDARAQATQEPPVAVGQDDAATDARTQTTHEGTRSEAGVSADARPGGERDDEGL